MKVVEHYCIDFDANLKLLLDREKIKYEYYIENCALGWHKLVFDLKRAPNDMSLYNQIPYEPSCSWYEYSDKELSQAKWLTFRTTTPKLNIVDDSAIAYTCTYTREVRGELREFGKHQRQVKPFALRPVKWKPKNHIYSAYYSDCYVFCDDHVKDLIKGQGFSGIDFGPVYKGKTSDLLENVSQIFINEVIPNEALILPSNAKHIICPFCKKTSYEWHSKCILGVKEEYLKPEFDFCRTETVFSGRDCALWLVSQKVYSFFKENELLRGLVFEPVVMY